MEPAVAFGKVLRRMRKRAALTQERLAFEAELRRTYVSILELGQQQPSLSTILKIAAALGCSSSELMAAVEAEMAPKVISQCNLICFQQSWPEDLEILARVLFACTATGFVGAMSYLMLNLLVAR